MTATKHFLRTISRLLPVAAIIGGVYFFYRPQLFIAKWSGRFARIETMEAARTLERTESEVFVHTLPSGEWFVATCEHSCCTGAGYNASVIRDSAGAIHSDTSHSFCGLQGMVFELSDSSINSLADFYPHIQKLNFRKR